MTRAAKFLLPALFTVCVAFGTASPSVAQVDSPAISNAEQTEKQTQQDEPAANLELLPNQTVDVFPGREVWLVSARTNGACEDNPRLMYWRYEAGQWVKSSLEELSAGPPLPTCVWTHGNWVSHSEAAIIGWKVYEQFKRCHENDFRLIIWSWPADRQGKVRQDVRNKAIRADQFAYPLAWMVDRLPQGSPVSLLGFSYGARLDAGALNLLGGGCQAGRYLERLEGASPRPMRGVFLAAALDNFALAPDAAQAFALPFAQRIVNFYNRRDGVLDLYPLLWRIGGPKAAGYTGLVGYGGPYASKVFEMNVARIVGPKHEWDRYFYSPSIMSRIINETLFLDIATSEHGLEVEATESAASALPSQFEAGEMGDIKLDDMKMDGIEIVIPDAVDQAPGNSNGPALVVPTGN